MSSMTGTSDRSSLRLSLSTVCQGEPALFKSSFWLQQAARNGLCTYASGRNIFLALEEKKERESRNSERRQSQEH